MRPRVYQSRRRGFYAGVAYLLGAGLGVVTILGHYSYPGGVDIRMWLALLLLPPAWVVTEYVFLFDNWGDERAVRELKYGHLMASIIWLVLLFVCVWSERFYFW